MAKRKKPDHPSAVARPDDYDSLIAGISDLLDQARRATARAVNSLLTATYWEVGRRVVEFEQAGAARAGYGEQLLDRLAADLASTHGRGFSIRNLRNMRAFYLGWAIRQTPSAELTGAVPSRPAVPSFPLPWSHYVRLLSVGDQHARAFYEAEAVRGGWSSRQLDRQIATQFYERTARSPDPARLLAKGQRARPEDTVTVREEIRDPYLLEFLDLKDEYGESDLEEALVRHLETFLLELGTGFTFVARQKRIRVGDEWYRIDLLLFHRRLRCLIVIDLKRGK